jgi:DNA-binding NtrC family response regulator
MNVLSALVIDNEAYSLEVIEKFVHRHPSLLLEYSTLIPLDLYHWLRSNSADVAFIEYDLKNSLTCEDLLLLLDAKNIPAIVFTANISVSQDLLSVFSNLVDVIYKPVDYHDFSKAVSVLLE